MSTSLPSSQIESFLHELCKAAAQQTLPRFRQSLDVSNKQASGFDPVTEADRQAEQAIRALIKSRYPDHGIVGEEFGTENPQAEYCWIIDPVDGTRAFISGIPLWGTLIGLYRNGRPFMGVMDQPFTGERFIGTPGTAHLSKAHKTTNLTTSSVTAPSEATVMTTDPNLFKGREERQFQALAQQAQLCRYGTDCYAYCMVAAGQAEWVLESGLSIYDIAALIPIVEGAGGIVTNWSGGDASQGGQVLAAANKTIHAAALEILAQ